MSDFIEYTSILFEIVSDDVFISAVGDDMHPVSFYCELLTYMASKTFWTDVGSFLPMMRIQTVLLFLSGNE